MEAQEIIDWFERVRKRGGNSDEWYEILDAINEFVKSDNPESEKRRFYPLGYGEAAGMICDGITRWRNSICIKCRKQKGHEEYSCAIYPQDAKLAGGIPNEIWANENADCPFYEKKQI